MVTSGVFADARISERSPSVNYGSDTNLFVTYINDQRQWSLISFPSNMFHILKISLYCYRADTNGPIYAYKVLSNWNENTITWNNQPAVGELISSIPFVTLNAWNDIPINKLAYEIPYGIKLTTSSGRNIVFYSKEANSNKPIVVCGYSNLLFVDSFSSSLIFSDMTPGLPLDFTQIVAGNVSSIKAIDLYNYNDFSVSDPIVYLENLPSGDTIEISKFNDPFIQSPEVHFDGTFAPGSYIGTFYVRVKPGENSSGSKSFRIKAKATPV